MKNLIKLLPFYIAFAFVFSNCSKDDGPDVPGINVNSVATSNAISLSWRADEVAREYVVYFAEGENAELEEVEVYPVVRIMDQEVSMSHGVTGLESGKEYRFKIEGKNTDGEVIEREQFSVSTL